MEIIPANSSLVCIGIAMRVVIALKTNKQAKELITDHRTLSARNFQKTRTMTKTTMKSMYSAL